MWSLYNMDEKKVREKVRHKEQNMWEKWEMWTMNIDVLSILVL